jgi:hypothetical protein
LRAEQDRINDSEASAIPNTASDIADWAYHPIARLGANATGRRSVWDRDLRTAPCPRNRMNR